MIAHACLTAALVAAFSSAAFAFRCPVDIRAIDASMNKFNLGPSGKAEVKKLRDEGEALHNSGKHQQAVDKLAEAMGIFLRHK